MNIVEVLGLEIASFGAWDDADAEVMSACGRSARRTASCCGTTTASPGR